MSGALVGVKRLLVILVKTVGLVLAALTTFVLVFAVFFFAVPEITIPIPKIQWLMAKFLPQDLHVDFSSLDVRISRPGRQFLAKRFEVSARDFCVTYQDRAVHGCFEGVSLSATGGWSTSRRVRETQSRLRPRLLSIDPILLIGGEALVDLRYLKTAEKKEKPQKNEPSAGGKVVDLLRKEILPKWRLEGSRVDLSSIEIVAKDGSRTKAGFELVTLQGGDTLRATLRNLDLGPGKPRVNASIRAIKSTGRSMWAWKVYADGRVDAAGKKRIDLLADADIFDWRSADFRIGARLKNVAALREARLAGHIEGDVVSGLFSQKIAVATGDKTSELRALDFVNCAVNADLGQKVGGVKCGPQEVRLALKERTQFGNPNLFVFRPAFELRLMQLTFGEVKSAHYEFILNIDHADLLKAAVRLDGFVRAAPGERLSFAVQGDANVAINHFQRVVEILKPTPYAVPAPLHELNGPVTASAEVNFSETGGDVPYGLELRLDSRHQSAHARLDGRTLLIGRVGTKEFHVKTDLTIAIEEIRLSAPRFEMAPPPQMALDARFAPIQKVNGKPVPEAEAPKKGKPLDLTVRIATTRPEAIRIATNMTKTAIPIGLNLKFESEGARGRLRPVPIKSGVTGPLLTRGQPHLGSQSGATSAPIRESQAANVRNANGESGPASLTGDIHVGGVPIEVFKRVAKLEKFNVTMRPDGQRVLDGLISVHSPDYEIHVIVAGTEGQPQILFESDPPLSDNQIIAVLLFGRPLSDLDESEQESVSNLNAAVTDAVLGVGSLYFLANSPVESIGYDPDHKRVTAKVALGGGTTLEIGGLAGQGSGVGVRKKLSREWVLRSDVEQLGPTNARTVSAFLEWVKRF
jgi:hypothetical protein